PGVGLAGIRGAPVRDESLLAVEDPFVAVEARGRLQTPGVTSRLRLRESPCPELRPFRERNEPFLFLFLGGEPQEGGLGQGRLHGDRSADGRRAPAQFLHQEHEGDVVHARATVLLRDGSPEEAYVGHLRVEGPRELAFLLPLPHVWGELCVDVLAGRLLNGLLLVCAAKVQRDWRTWSTWADPLT